MTRRISSSLALLVASAAAQAHEGLELDSPLHHALHAIGTERLVVIGGTALAVVVGLLVRRALRAAAERRSAG